MEEFNHLRGKEKLKAENDFYKLKLMLEEDICFDGTEELDFSSERENQFLKNLVEIEDRCRNGKKERLFEKIGRPDFFYPAGTISNDCIDEALEGLVNFLQSHNIHFEVVSPNISSRECYRFIVEELFDEELNDMGFAHDEYHFIYDDFHPDPVFENTSLAMEDCMGSIFNNTPLEYIHNFFEEGLRLNQHYPLNAGGFMKKINQFKNAYDHIELNDVQRAGYIAGVEESRVSGIYRATARLGAETIVFSGQWLVILETGNYTGNQGWHDIRSVTIDGVNF